MFRLHWTVKWIFVMYIDMYLVKWYREKIHYELRWKEKKEKKSYMIRKYFLLVIYTCSNGKNCVIVLINFNFKLKKENTRQNCNYFEY